MHRRRRRIRGAAAGVFSLAGTFGILTATLLGGEVFDRIAYTAPFTMMAIVNGLVVIAALLVRARRSQIAGIAALTWLTYLMVSVAGGRLRALLACAAFAVTPPVFDAGYVLRAESAGALFATLSVFLLQLAARPRARLRARSPRRAAVVSGGLMACSID